MTPHNRVLLGFSGGTDSCHAAGLLRREGYSVTPLYMDMYGDRGQLEWAQQRAREMGLHLRVADLRGDFRSKVVEYFASEYMAGRTPAPCTICNRDIKWMALSRIADQEGFGHIATGHYFNIERSGDRFYVARAADTQKDQSYYLWPLTQHILSRTLTPMGDQIKGRIAARAKESMGVCFLGGKGCGEYLRGVCGSAIHPGDICDSSGMVIGRHDGTPLYTIGQKRGLGLPAGLCVTAIDARSNRLTAGTDADLYHRNLVIGGVNIVDRDEILTATTLTVMIRGIGRNPVKPCRISEYPWGLHIRLDDPAWAAAVGQPVVIYNGNRVAGGGFLEEYYP